ncbi:ABC transporter ATP-binding protein [Tychonema sp. LEGE 07199]|uniref:ABC transporter ATP-binding protein n=1 Tax=unclassified Tychonema TaxID=2642144 RepID=UPI0018819DA8|nr:MULTISPECIES: ABC transporter ATP-binding protein [unclassified Tychonema]MBE9121510.1 ABC transporter ATP-binding protein [Tychonema sp. LEGE 07199]MBE9132319.1 ABC transporter ATP-binding protein [Tychonema sp. LEGE 07196]
MTENVISLKNVSKCFKRYDRPGDRLKEIIYPNKKFADEFWALSDINLEIPKGQTLGVVGRNGSGKSTLLQIIVGTLTPTAGSVRVQGRISALLELGSGFNPEFTGRQNVFFNAQILGFNQKETEEKFDEIAAFADIGDFIDQPVKTYSSGMFVRLAFAVATSVEPDILVVDEALSVGDEAFQRKCFARLQSIQEGGGTILFVSHAASSVVQLCTSAILMDSGELLLAHTPKVVISKYQKLIYADPDKVLGLKQDIRVLNQLTKQESQENLQNPNLESTKTEAVPEQYISQPKEHYDEFYEPGMIPSNTVRYPSRGAEIINPRIETLQGNVVNHLLGRQDYVYTYSVTFSRSTSKVRFGMLIKTISGFELAGASLKASTQSVKYVEAGTTILVKFQFKCLLNPGVYFLNAGVVGTVDEDLSYLDRCVDVAMFKVQSCTESCGNGIVDLLIEPCLTVVNYDCLVQEQSTEVI